MEIFLLLLACSGITFTFVHAEIMNILGIRPFLNKWEFTRKLQKCALCSGTYISALVGIFYISYIWLIPFIFAGAGFSFLFERICILLDELIIHLEKE
jgi:uncharacterized membrane protein